MSAIGSNQAHALVLGTLSRSRSTARPGRCALHLVSIVLSLPMHVAAANPCSLIASPVTLTPPLVITYEASSALGTGSDPFQPYARVKDGIDKGRPIKTDLFRPIQIIPPSMARQFGFSPRPGEIFIANLNHMNEFYVAGIPLDAVSQVIYQIQKFHEQVPALAHGQIRLKFRDTVVLRPQKENQGSAIATTDLVFSMHAVGADHEYEPVIKGTDGSYSLVLGVFTTETKVAENARRGFSVEQWRLNLSQDQKRAYILRYLELSQKWGYFKPYHTRDHNCGSEMIKILDAVIGYSSKPGEEADLTDSLGERYPFLVVPALRKRGLVGNAKDSRDYDLEKDPESWIRSIYRSYEQETPPQPRVSPTRLGS